MEGAGPGQRIGHDSGMLSPITCRAIRSTRRIISAAARREKVISRIWRGSAPLTIKMGHAMRQGVGLARPRPGNDEQRTGRDAR